MTSAIRHARLRLTCDQGRNINYSDAVPPLDRKIDRFRVPKDDRIASSRGKMAERWLLEGQQHDLTGLSVHNLTVTFEGHAHPFFVSPQSTWR